MELRSQNATANSLQSSNTGNSNRLPGPGNDMKEHFTFCILFMVALLESIM